MGPGFFYYHRGPDGRQVRRVLLFLAVSGLLAFVLGVCVTILCFRIRRMDREDKQDKESEERHGTD